MRNCFLCIVSLIILPVFAQKIDTVETYYPGEILQSEGILIDGKPDGLWKSYYPNGIIKSEGKWANGKLDGNWVFLDYNGDTTSVISYLEGKKNGFQFNYYKTTDENECNSVKSKELFVNNKKEGKSCYYYNCGKLKEEVNYKDNKKEGNSFGYDENGNLISIERYKYNDLIERNFFNAYDENGDKTAEWRQYYTDGNLKRIENYSKGILNGISKEYNRKGEVIATVQYDFGNIVDTVFNFKYEIEIREEFDKEGNLITRGGFKNSIPVGAHNKYGKSGEVIQTLIYSNDGILKSKGIITKEGKRNGKWENYYDDGKISSKGSYKNNLRIGDWKFFYTNEKVEQVGNYNNGRKNGTWLWYYPNGSIWKEETFFNGKLEGIYTEYSENGEITVEGEYFDDEQEGEWKIKIGDHFEKGKFVTGLQDGIWKHYYADGTLRFEGNYIQGSEDGKHKIFYPDGTLKEERFYQSGMKVKHWNKYNQFGELLITITYKNNKEYRINGQKIEFYNDDILHLQ